jgi:hypothetical protein
LQFNSLARGNSLGFKLEKCSAADWTISAIFVVIMIFLVFVATRLSAKEQALK